MAPPYIYTYEGVLGWVLLVNLLNILVSLLVN
jgi:hypothetical protein